MTSRKYLRSSSLLLVLMVLCGLLLTQTDLTTVRAGGDPTIIGSPFNITVDSYGTLDLQNGGLSQFYNGTDDGLILVIGANKYDRWGDNIQYTPVSNGPVTGTGSKADPFKIITVFDGGTDVRVTQTTTYVNGDTNVYVSYDFSTTPLNGPHPNFSRPVNIEKAYFAADLYLSGGDEGYGYYNPGTHAVGAFNAAKDNYVLFQPVSPSQASAYQEAYYGNIWDITNGGLDFNNTIDETLIDNGAGLQWNNVSIPGNLKFLISAGSQIPSEVPIVKPVVIPADLGAQLRVTPDRLAANSAGTELTFTLFIKNLDKGKAKLPYVILPIDPNLEVVNTNFTDSRDWVNNVVTDGTNPHLEIRFHDLEQGQIATASVTFKVKAGVASGAVVSQRFTVRWDDDVAAARSHQSNSIRVVLSDNNTDQSAGKIQQFNPANPTVIKGSPIPASADFFAPGEKVSLWYTDKNGQSTSLGYQWADMSGKINFNFKTAGLEPGSYAISGQGDHSGFFASDKSTVSGQMIVMVNEGMQQFTKDDAVVTGANVTQYKGNFFSAGERVDLWLSGPDGKSTSMGYLWADQNGCVSFPVSIAGMAAGNYTVGAFGSTSKVTAKTLLSIAF